MWVAPASYLLTIVFERPSRFSVFSTPRAHVEGLYNASQVLLQRTMRNSHTFNRQNSCHSKYIAFSRLLAIT